jgi:hypothetical protein
MLLEYVIMSQNQKLIAAIKEFSKNRPHSRYNNIPPNEKSDALDSILRADPNNASQFRKGVLSKREIWEQFGIMDNDQDDLSLDVNGFLDPTGGAFEEIRQVAAEERVKLQFSLRADEEILINLLKYNPDECRAYLQEKITSLNIQQLTDNPNTAPGRPKKVSADEYPLNNLFINDLKVHAAIIHLQRLIESAPLDKLVHLKKLTGPIQSPQVLTATAKALGFPAEGIKVLTDEYNDRVYAGIGEVLTKRVDDLQKTDDLAKFDAAVRGLSLNDNWLLDNEPLLSSGQGDPFGHKFIHKKEIFKDINIKNINNELIDKAHKELCARYIQAKLLRDGASDSNARKSILKASTVDELKDKLFSDDNHNQLSSMLGIAQIDKDNLASFKIPLVKHFIFELEDTPANRTLLAEIRDARTVDVLIMKLTSQFQGVPLDFLKKGVLTEYQNQANKRLVELEEQDNELAFKKQIEKISPVASSQVGSVHPKLLEVFGDLPPAQQKNILQNPDQIRFMLKAKTPAEIIHYLGGTHIDSTSLQADVLVEENKKVALFSQLYNPALARALLAKEVSSTKEGIKAINEYLLSRPRGQLDVNGLMQVIEAQCTGTDTFKKALNKNKDPLKSDIEKQHAFNGDLFERIRPFLNAQNRRVRPAEPAEVRFHELLLRIEKKTNFNLGERYWASLKKSKNIKEFWTSVGEINGGIVAATKGETQKKAVKKELDLFLSRLSNELTPTVYTQLKARSWKRDIKKNPGKLPETLDNVKRELAGILVDSGLIKKHQAKLKDVNEYVQEGNDLIRLYNPLYEKNAKYKIAEMKSKYKELAEDCDMIIERLQGSQRTLKALEQCVADAQIRVATELKKTIADELKITRAQLDFYQNLRTKIVGEQGILGKVDEVSQGLQRCVYQSSRVKVTTINRNEADRRPAQPNTPVSENATAVETNTDQNLLKSHFKEAPKSDQLLCFELTTPKRTQNGIVNETSRFTLDTNPEGAAPSSIEKGELHRSLPTVLKLTKIPQDPQGRAEYFMLAAMTTIDNWNGHSPILLKGVAGKKEDLIDFWTALQILHEDNPKLGIADHIGFSEENTVDFAPSSQKGLFGIGYKEDSSYKTLFKGVARVVVDNKLKDFKTYHNITEDKNRVDKSVTNAAQFRKDLVKMKENVEEKVKAEGHSPAALPYNKGPNHQ